MKNKKSQILLLAIFILALFLRLYKISKFPPSIYWEEAAIGVDANSILKTGKDMHGNSFPLVAFRSFGDWKPSLYFYAAVPSIAVFGLNEFAVRFPSALFGGLTCVVLYFLVKELISPNSLTSEVSKDLNQSAPGAGTSFAPGARDNPHYSLLITHYLPIIASLLLAISPWHLQFSRAGFEANLAVFLITLATYFFLRATETPGFLWASAVCFVLSCYTYHGARLFSPLFALGLGLIFWKKLVKNKKAVILAFLLALVMMLPLIYNMADERVQRRFRETSAFATLQPIIESNKKIEEDGNTRLAKIIHHRFWHYGGIFLSHYFDQFRPSFLFLNGDLNPRHKTGELGLFYFAQIPILLYGFFAIFKNKEKRMIPILLWIVLGAVPAGMTKATPHALRFLISVPAWQIISTYGIVQVLKNIKTQGSRFKVQGSIILCCLLFTLCFVRYFHFYYKHYPLLYSQDWQYGYKQAMKYVLENQNKYDNVYITREYGRPSIYYFFYEKIDPKIIQKEGCAVKKDLGEFLEFRNIEFKTAKTKELEKGKNLVVAAPGEYNRVASLKALQKINFLNGKEAFVIYEN